MIINLIGAGRVAILTMTGSRKLAMPRILAMLMFALPLGALLLRTPAFAQSVTVFAASSLTEALNEAASHYSRVSRDRVRISYANSATLARQIESGAPADIFFSADDLWMDYLDQRKLLQSGSRQPRLGNRLVLAARADAAQRVDLRKGMDFAALLGRGRLAMGHPDSVPAGIYGKQALIWLGVWDDVSARLAMAENVRVALAFVERGEAPLGIVYATDLAVAPGTRQVAEFPAESHRPIVYSMAVIAGRNRAQVAAFYAYLAGPAVSAVLKRHGFQVNNREIQNQ